MGGSNFSNCGIAKDPGLVAKLSWHLTILGSPQKKTWLRGVGILKVYTSLGLVFFLRQAEYTSFGFGSSNPVFFDQNAKIFGYCQTRVGNLTYGKFHTNNLNQILPANFNNASCS